MATTALALEGGRREGKPARRSWDLVQKCRPCGHQAPRGRRVRGLSGTVAPGLVLGKALHLGTPDLSQPQLCCTPRPRAALVVWKGQEEGDQSPWGVGPVNDREATVIVFGVPSSQLHISPRPFWSLEGEGSPQLHAGTPRHLDGATRCAPTAGPVSGQLPSHKGPRTPAWGGGVGSLGFIAQEDRGVQTKPTQGPHRQASGTRSGAPHGAPRGAVAGQAPDAC